jgi:hypothetical protein
MGRIFDARSRIIRSRYGGAGGPATGPQSKTPTVAIALAFGRDPAIQANAIRFPASASSIATANTPSVSTGAGAQILTPPVAIGSSIANTPFGNRTIVADQAVAYTFSNAPKANRSVIAPVAISASTAVTPASSGSNSVSDDFAGTGALSGSWTTLGGTASRVGGVYQASVVPSAYFRNDYFPGSDQTVEVTLDILASNISVYARLDHTVGNGYYCGFYSSGDAILYRVDGGVFTGLASFPGNVWNTGDVVGLRIVGSTLKVLQNGSQVGTDFVDSTYSAGGVVVIGTQTTFDTIAAFQASSP